MASTSGLTRRRGGGGGTVPDNEDETARVSSPAPKRPESRGAPETSYESSSNGHKIAYDPRDMAESAERSKQPKLTLMEEVLLMGLKDKQVRWRLRPWSGQNGLVILDMANQECRARNRDTCPFGTITSPTLYAAA